MKNSSSFIALLILVTCCWTVTATGTATKDHRKPTNIIMILADDLGFGDTSVRPFTGNGISTPNLEAMAAKGTVLSNFHSAATVCTPTRASILTGMNPWRVGIKAVYEYGIKGNSNRDDWMPLVPTAAAAFRAANYTTSHSGKWHLGGMRDDDYNLRVLNESGSGNGTEAGSRRCPHPGPNQQGFDEYVSVLDGPGAPRQNRLQVRSNLYSQGCNALLRNDKPLGGDGGFPAGKNPSGDASRMTLSDCEAGHAVRMMQESVQKEKPFYMHLWFHAPHGPWEYLPGYEDVYAEPTAPLDQWPVCDVSRQARYCVSAIKGCVHKKQGNPNPCFKKIDRGKGDRMAQYRTMVSAMDKAIGYVLKSIHDLGIERDTLVVFTSDNGPEMDSGCIPLHLVPNHPWPKWNNWGQLYSTVGMRGNKRFVYEGGLKVPTIVQWVGTVAKGRTSDVFAYSTDLLPTFLQAAGLPVPKNMRLDGMSLLPELVSGAHLFSASSSSSSSNASSKDNGSMLGHTGNFTITSSTHHEHASPRILPAGDSATGNSGINLNVNSNSSGGGSRTLSSSSSSSKDGMNEYFLLTADKETLHAARKHTRKMLAERVVFWHNDYEGPRLTAARVLDFKLLLDGAEAPYELFDLRSDPREIHNLLAGISKKELDSIVAGTATAIGGSVQASKIGSLIADVESNRGHIRDSKSLHMWIFGKLFESMRDYAKHGNAGHLRYLAQNIGRNYAPTAASDFRQNSREFRLVGGIEHERQKAKHLAGQCSTPCACERPKDALQVPAFPVDDVGQFAYIMPKWPQGFVNVTELLLK